MVKRFRIIIISVVIAARRALQIIVVVVITLTPSTRQNGTTMTEPRNHLELDSGGLGVFLPQRSSSLAVLSESPMANLLLEEQSVLCDMGASKN